MRRRFLTMTRFGLSRSSTAVLLGFSGALIASFVVIATPKLGAAEDSVAAATAAAEAAQRKKNALYNRLGGSKGLNEIIDTFLESCAADETINHYFKNVFSDRIKLRTYKFRLVDHFCMTINGPCRYTGKAMLDAHAGMGIKKSEFKAYMKHFKAAMVKQQIAEKDIKKVMKKFRALRMEVVKAPGKAVPAPTFKPYSIGK